MGKFYIVTDGSTHTFPEGYAHFWDEIDKAVVGQGFPSLHGKAKLPLWLMMMVAHICDAIGWLTGTKIKLNPFAVKMLTMHR